MGFGFEDLVNLVPPFFVDEITNPQRKGFFDFADVVMVVGMVILLVAIPASFVKWRKMTQRRWNFADG